MASSETLRIPAYLRKKQLKKKVKKTVKRKVAKKIVKKKAVKKIVKKMPKVALKPIGKITHFYDKISVGVLKLTNTLNVGDKIRLKGKAGEFDQLIKSMQMEHQQINVAKKGDDIGIKVNKPVKVDAMAFKVG